MIKNKKIFSILIALFMVLSLASPMLAEATPPDSNGETPSLTIHKLYFEGEMGDTIPGTGEVQTPPAGTTPLADAEFTIWLVADDAEMPYIPSGTGRSIITDANGEAFFDNLAYGRYYVVETDVPAGITERSVPFMVDIPTTSIDGTKEIKDVHVYPKNVLTLARAQMTKLNETENGLAGAEFDLYKVGEPDVKINTVPLVTDGDGNTPIVENLEVGDYYFVETKAPEEYLIDTTPQEFTVTEGDNGVLFENTLINSEKPGVPVKEVDKTNAGIGDKVTWTINTQLPRNIETYDKYMISDNLDVALNYDKNVIVTLEGNTLVEGTHYNLVQPTLGATGLLEINFIPEELNGGNLVITFDTIVNENAKAGTDLKNQAILVYDNGFQVEKEESNIPKVKVGGHKFRKIDGSEKVLEGAEFIVRRESDDKYLVKDANGMISWSNDETDAFKFDSDSNGLFFVDGVAFGKYFLIETKAPAGYSKLQNPVEFTVSENTHTIKLPIVNKTKPGMPQTGGMGTILFSIIGLGLMGVAAKTYKKEEE